MLTVYVSRLSPAELDQLSDKELERAVREYCSRYGVVLDVTIMRPKDPRNEPVAAVEMATRGEADKVLRACGDMESGTTVVMHLVPPIPAVRG
jgi:hypothetical protein